MIISTKDFDFARFARVRTQRRPSGNKGTKKKAFYKDLVTAFDIETTRIPEIDQSVMYVWQWQFGDWFTVVGRTWQELAEFIDKLNGCMKDDHYLVVYVHNLSYEFQFLRAIHEWDVNEVFAVKSRKILKCTWGHLEFRCSYIHSNMSLGVYLSKMNVKHQKLDGDEYDYEKRRYPWTPLTDKEMEYCVNDVLGLVEALTTEMKLDGDNLYTIPLTSTGYVRRDVRNSMKPIVKNVVTPLLPALDVYELLHKAMRGGNTHANRFFADAGTVLDVHSADRSSSYPDVQCNDEFPMTKFRQELELTPERMYELINDQHRAVLWEAKFTNVRLSDPFWPCPYLSFSKCENISGEELDNGRVLRADTLVTAGTDIDLRIMLEEYDWDDMEIVQMWSSRYGKLPDEMTSVIKKYYSDKTALKGNEAQKVFYEKQKNKLNGIYGMSAQDPVKENVEFHAESKEQFIVIHEDHFNLLMSSYKRAFMPYQWGVWTTAWARYRLEEGIRLAGHNFVYCDTDSVKYIGDIDWTAYNEERKQASIRSGAHATDAKGEEHYMGVYEDDGFYDKFRTMGAKKYVVMKKDKLEVTIAGVSKKKGGKELAKNGGIDSFEVGFKFVEAGGTESVYNDVSYGEYMTEEGPIVITPNVCIRPSTYTLGHSKDYMALLEKLHGGNSVADNYFS